MTLERKGSILDNPLKSPHVGDYLYVPARPTTAPDHAIIPREPPPLQPHHTGWQCPACKAIHAPWVQYCGCSPPRPMDIIPQDTPLPTIFC